MRARAIVRSKVSITPGTFGMVSGGEEEPRLVNLQTAGPQGELRQELTSVPLPISCTTDCPEYDWWRSVPLVPLLVECQHR